MVVPNWVLRRLPRIPWRPSDMLMKARPTKVFAFVQAGWSLSPEREGWPLFQKAMAPAMVNTAWMKVPRTSHRRL